MTIVSLVVIWLAVGLVVAVVFGYAVSHTNRFGDDGDTLQRSGADLKYLRHTKRARHHPIRPAPAQAATGEAVKKSPTRRRVAG